MVPNKKHKIAKKTFLTDVDTPHTLTVHSGHFFNASFAIIASDSWFILG